MNLVIAFGFCTLFLFLCLLLLLLIFRCNCVFCCHVNGEIKLYYINFARFWDKLPSIRYITLKSSDGVVSRNTFLERLCLLETLNNMLMAVAISLRLYFFYSCFVLD